MTLPDLELNPATARLLHQVLRTGRHEIGASRFEWERLGVTIADVRAVNNWIADAMSACRDTIKNDPL